MHCSTCSLFAGVRLFENPEERYHCGAQSKDFMEKMGICDLKICMYDI